MQPSRKVAAREALWFRDPDGTARVELRRIQFQGITRPGLPTSHRLFAADGCAHQCNSTFYRERSTVQSMGPCRSGNAHCATTRAVATTVVPCIIRSR